MNKRRSRSTYRTTMRDWREIDRQRMNQSLWGRAAIASGLAKIAWGDSRAKLYRIKHLNLDCLLAHGAGVVGLDTQYDPPLISVIYGEKRLHVATQAARIRRVG